MDRSVYFDESGFFAKNDVITISHISDSDYNDYVLLERENRYFRALRSMFDELMKSFWESIESENDLFCTVRKTGTNEFCGYCNIHDLTEDELEIGITLLESVQNQGIGYNTLKVFMEKFKEISGVDHFIAKVASDNYASQRLMEKLGGVPDGLCNGYLLKTDEVKKQFEDEHLELIDEKMIVLAKKFGVEPRKLLSHVLKYRIDV